MSDITKKKMQIHSKGYAAVPFQLMFMLPYFSMVKLPLGSVTLRWATASSRLNT